jgi:hypothetical protein
MTTKAAKVIPIDSQAPIVFSNAQPLPAHVASLLQAEGMSYDPVAFSTMTPEQHTEEGFKGLRVSVLAAMYSGAHFSQVIEKIENHDGEKSANRLADFKSARAFIEHQAEQRGIGRQTIYNTMGIYKLYCRAPEQLVSQLQSVGVTKLIELKHLQEQDLAQLAQGEEVQGITLETIQDMSVRELKATLKENRAENNALKTQLKSLQNKLDTEARNASAHFAEAQRLKALPEERRIFGVMREQILSDIELAQGIITRAQKLFDVTKNFSGEVEGDAITAVIHPLYHLLSVMHGGAQLIAGDVVDRFNINPEIPLNPPNPELMTEDERWRATQTAAYQKQQTEQWLARYTDKPKKDRKKKGDK